MAFITNTGNINLGTRIGELIQKSKELKFLVGFFYFSGIKELYENIIKNNEVILKVLVGLNVDSTIYGLLEYDQTKSRLTDEEIANKYLKSLKTSLSSEEFDSKDFYEQVRFFVNLIKENRLVIRKTFNPNHSKLYLFKIEDIVTPTLFITGSSNLTKAGLESQNEFNVEIKDYGFDEAEKYFDNLWNDAVLITEDNIIKQRLIKTLEEETLIKKITPFEAYAFVLKTYLDSFKKKNIGECLLEILEENNYKPYKYQLDAVKEALSIIEINNGVIIADVVGLGKTVIACSIAFELKKRGIVISPPGLVGNEAGTEGWNKYLEDFRLTAIGWKAFSLGDLEKVKEYVDRVKDVEVVIVDEAHRFRNEDTKDYELLKNICRGKIVILLTATPFNNKPSDIFSLLKLFITPRKSSITLTDNLEAKFVEYKNIFEKLSYIKRYYNSHDIKKREAATSRYKKIFGDGKIDLTKVKEKAHQIAKQIKNTIEPVTIRRNRLDLKKNPFYKDEVKELSRVSDPQEWFYELTEEQSKFYDKVINEYFAYPDEGGLFNGAIYKPFLYKIGINNIDELEKEENFQYMQQANLYDFMRRLLVKRFESSFGAFKKSVENFKSIIEKVEKFVNRTGKYILDRELLLKIYNRDIDEIEEELANYVSKISNGEYPTNHEIYKLDDFKDKELFLNHIQKDKELFENILIELKKLDLLNNDPKVLCLIENIKKIKDGRKIVIFSEYVDTVKYLEPILQNEFNNSVLVVAGTLTKAKTKEIYQNFDASLPKQQQADDYHILLATDKISEGFNLNRAGIVINYDIPWNPVRVIQRLGRINRISKKVFDELYIVNFFPTEKGSDIVHSREIARNKMFLIHNALGEDSKIFDIDEEPSPAELYEKINKNPESLEEESFYTKILEEFEEIKQKYPQLVKELNDFPSRLKVAKKGNKNELFVVIKKGHLFVNYRDYETKVIDTKEIEDIIDKIKPASIHEPPMEISERFWEEYEKIKNYKETYRGSTSEQSLEVKAINNIKTILRFGRENIVKYKEFLNMLLEDIIDYGTLSDYTLRRISNIDVTNENEIIKELEKLKKELGENYLYKEKERLKKLTKEIIVAIENRVE